MKSFWKACLIWLLLLGMSLYSKWMGGWWTEILQCSSEEKYCAKRYFNWAGWYHNGTLPPLNGELLWLDCCLKATYRLWDSSDQVMDSSDGVFRGANSDCGLLSLLLYCFWLLWVFGCCLRDDFGCIEGLGSSLMMNVHHVNIRNCYPGLVSSLTGIEDRI